MLSSWLLGPFTFVSGADWLASLVIGIVLLGGIISPFLWRRIDTCLLCILCALIWVMIGIWHDYTAAC